MFRIQTTINGKSWRNLPFAQPYVSADDAWEHARALDEDGFLTPAVRVVDEEGKPAPRPKNGDRV